MLGKKQNFFDDFECAAEWLIQNKYTNPTKLAIMGTGNGDLEKTLRPVYVAVQRGVASAERLSTEV